MATEPLQDLNLHKKLRVLKNKQLKSQETLLWEQFITPKSHDVAQAALFFVIPGK